MIGYSFYLYLRSSEVHDQSEFQLRRPEIVQALSRMRLSEKIDRLQLNQYASIHQQIGEVLTDDLAIISNDHALLLLDNPSAFPQFVSQRVLINLFKEATAQCIADLEAAANNLL